MLIGLISGGIGWFHPALHPVFEALGYAAGFAVYKAQRASSGDALTDERRWIIIAAAAVGALLGARLLGLLEQAPRLGLHWSQLLQPGGKTIVGGLLGGWAAVELAKKLSGVRSRTGDLFAVPLCIGIAVGRLAASSPASPTTPTASPPTSPGPSTSATASPATPPSSTSSSSSLSSPSSSGAGNIAPTPKARSSAPSWPPTSPGDSSKTSSNPNPSSPGMNWIQWACVAGLIALAVGEIRKRFA